MCATGESRLSGSRAPLGHHTSGIHTRHEVPTCGALSAIGRRHLGDTHGVTLGDTVSPSCIPPLTCKFPRKYKALADRSADRNNPDSPLGDHPSGSQSPPPCRILFSDGSMFPLRSLLTIMAFSQMDRRFIGGTAEMEQSWLRICVAVHRKGRKDRHELSSFVGDWNGGQDNSLKCKVQDLLATIWFLAIEIFRNFADRDFSNFFFLLIVFFADQIQKSSLCAPACTAFQTCTSAHIRAFYDKTFVL